ncbi:hypothetical protein KGF57_003616 [Candida theae]|uniref:Granaticin polyketide synthase ketoacyl reductase 2 n=1 Tax=Candida theae TaxID=1198502 RepID=A0AAD5BD46_9ASCO|nr:uncharacterized protein KGF57_003616 [Candida theae]KAI5955484.1 hypothetical protein KGF57_003616 [Candida theae]
MIQLKGKNALITGGSAGLGAAIAHQLAAEGVNIAINYANSKERAEALAKDIESKYDGVRAVTLKADVFKIDELTKLVDSTVEQLGGIDILISNAGWTKFVEYDDLEGMDEDVWDGTFNANIKAHYFLFKAAKKYFDANVDGGVFIASASVAGLINYGSSIPYAVSKAGLIHMIKFLAKTQGPKVRLHAVCPGLLLTEWGKKFPQEKIDLSKSKSPLGEVTDVDECAAQYILLSKLATSTGTVVTMDAGISL